MIFKNIETLSVNKPIVLDFYRNRQRIRKVLHLKLFKQDESFILSDTLPMLENMGLRLLSEQLFHITTSQREKCLDQ